ncbi:S41 family peptidase [Algoriphagus halophilus]|uniref:Tricorn protease C1 domain-containing protein n=1 Tax=Algoriphagus halophilus TaxID=226505 RepID=A0A1N6DUB1_9BACT|nr:S41 family peptidase [Algoriphagus halophilus]SIN74297.1 Tricorn protease C1 domain-containing protein [Algoriphagus halophilus]
MKNYYKVLFALLILSAMGCENAFFEPEPANNPEDIFENLWSTFNSEYAPFEERGVDWDQQYDIHRPQVKSSTTNEELINIIKSMLRSLDDGHVSFTTPNSDVFYSNRIIDQRIDDGLFDLDLIKSNYLQNDFLKSGNGLNTYGWLGNVGYWHIKAIGINMFDINSILDYFASADGLIVDMRHSSGGNFTYAFSEFGRLTDEERLVFSSKTKNGPGKNDYTELYEWSVYPKGKYFNKPIVLITDRYTISASERATMAFKALPNVTHVGDTTNGAIATKIGKELANGWFYSLVTQKTYFKDGKTFEGVGIPPEIYVKNTNSEMAAGQDKTLERALEEF